MCMVSLSVYLGGLPLWHHVELFVDLWLVITGANTIVGELDQLVYRCVAASRCGFSLPSFFLSLYRSDAQFASILGSCALGC